MLWNNRGAETAEQIGDALWVTKCAKEGLYPRRRKGGEEISQVEAEDNTAASVRGCESPDRAPFNKAVCGGMRRDFIQDFRQNLALQFLQPPFGRFDESQASIWFGKDPIVIMAELLMTRAGIQVPEIREPLQLAGLQPEPIAQFTNGFDARKIPCPCRRHWLHLLSLGYPASY